jgi:hypothetical protein
LLLKETKVKKMLLLLGEELRKGEDLCAEGAGLFG